MKNPEVHIYKNKAKLIYPLGKKKLEAAVIKLRSPMSQEDIGELLLRKRQRGIDASYNRRQLRFKRKQEIELKKKYV